MMKSNLLFVGVLSIAYAACPKGCDHPTAIYEDLQCEPIFANSTDCCPIKYDCSNIAYRPEGKCTYKGKVYELKEEIPTEETYGNCQIGCYCTGTDTIRCAILDCPEWLGARPKSGNYYTYSLNECCASGQRSLDSKTTAMCKVGENAYKEGERFDGDSRCMNCVCDKNWDGKFVEPFCVKSTCTDEMMNLYEIKSNCAPTYFNVKTACCPFKWICPDEKIEDKIIPVSKKSDIQKQCKYGSKLFNIGDKMERIEPISSNNHFEIKCVCQIPPFLTCVIKQIFT